MSYLHPITPSLPIAPITTTSPTHLSLIPLSPLSHGSVISLSFSLSSLVHNFTAESQFPLKRSRMDIFRQGLWAAFLRRINHVQTLMLGHKGHEVGLSIHHLIFWLHGNCTFNPQSPLSLPPCCPLDVCQAREQIGSRHWCMPKHSGKGSKGHVC